MGFFDRWRKKRSKRVLENVGTVGTDEEVVFPTVKPVDSTDDMLKEWSKTLEIVEKHPLSQARVINTGILNNLTHILNSMNEKLNSLNKLDKIVTLLLETKSQLENAGLSTRNVDVILSNIKGLTIKDEEALNYFKDGVLLTTEEFAKLSNLSRSTASSRLNKLFSLGVLEKISEGKKVKYKLRQ